MKLTIDTNQDSKDEIRKAIKMLSAIVGDDFYTNSYTNRPKAEVSNIFESSSSSIGISAEPAPVSAFASMFGDSSPSQAEPAEEKKEEKPERIQVIPY